MNQNNMTEIAAELAETWLNGNHKDVLEQLRKAPSKLKAAAVAVGIHAYLLLDARKASDALAFEVRVLREAAD